MCTIGAVRSGNGDIILVNERYEIMFGGVQRIDMRSN